MFFDKDVTSRLIDNVARQPAVALESSDNNVIVAQSIGEAFKVGADNFTPTINMTKRIINYSKNVKSRDDHIGFFGGNLLGVDRIKFYTADRERWFDEVLEIDEEHLRETLHSCPSVNTEWNVTSDVFNLTCVWLVHKLMKDMSFNNKQVREAAIEILVMMQFRFYTSIYSNYFKKPVDNEAAEATYSSLSMKFMIRQLGSWGAVLRARAESFIDSESTHYKTFQKFDNDEAILYIISDMQTRTRKTIKDQYAVLDMVRNGNLRIQTSSATMELDGDKIIRDRVNVFNSARHYLFDVSGNEASFIKRELTDVVLDIMSTVSEKAFTDVLKSIANTPQGKGRTEVEWMMETTLMHSFDYIAKNRIRFNDAGFILVKMRAMYMSSKSTDPTLLELRKRIEKYVKKHSHLKAGAALASARTSVMLYFLLRALYANTYS